MIILATAEPRTAARWMSAFKPATAILPVESFTSLRTCLRTHSNETVLLHRSLPGVGGIADIESLISDNAEANLFVLADVPQEQEGIELIRAGVLGYANTHIRPDILNEAVKVIELGEIWASKRLLQWMVNHCGSLDRYKKNMGSYMALDNLTPGERKIIGCLVEGDTNKQIAHKLQITERTVKAHLTSIFRKTGVNDRLHLALLVNNIRT